MFAMLTFMEIALEMWKWRLPWPFCIFSMSAGNDFQRLCGNQWFCHFQMFSISTPYGPYGGPTALDIAGRPRP
jgi:hypothetical protein